MAAGGRALNPTPYSLRHGGASHDALTNRRSLAEIKKKGRWRTDSSVRRYEKAAVAMKQLSKLPTEVVDYGVRAERTLSQLFLGASVPAPPPNLAAAMAAP